MYMNEGINISGQLRYLIEGYEIKVDTLSNYLGFDRDNNHIKILSSGNTI